VPIESKFNTLKPPKQGNSGNDDNLEAKLAAYKQEIAGLKRKLATADGQPNDGGNSSGGGGTRRASHPASITVESTEECAEGSLGTSTLPLRNGASYSKRNDGQGRKLRNGKSRSLKYGNQA